MSKSPMSNLSWDFVQSNSERILSCGLHQLTSQPYCSFTDVTEKGFGNYLISLDRSPLYIGEGSALTKRLKQQFKPNTSTFYKNYKKITLENQPTIDAFAIQFMPTLIGRKEIEEFGIVNLPTKLNGFQLDKKYKCSIADQSGLWSSVQKHANKLLEEAEIRVLGLTYKPWKEGGVKSNAGLYLVKDDSGHLIYVGESSDLSGRIISHSGKTYFSAFRRNVGRSVFGYVLQTINGKKRYFDPDEDERVTDFISACSIATYPVAFGRFELEEFLVKKYRPSLNRKGLQRSK